MTAAPKNYTNMKKTILFILLSVFTVSSFADFRVKAVAHQANSEGWEAFDYSNPQMEYRYIVYRKYDAQLSTDTKNSSISLETRDRKTKKKDGRSYVGVLEKHKPRKQIFGKGCARLLLYMHEISKCKI